MSDSLWPHGLQHTRLPCPSPTPKACSNSCPLSQWSHPTISSSVIPFSCLQSFLASGSFPMSQFFTSRGQSIGISFSISPSNEYSGLISFRMDWLDLLAVQGTLKSLLQHDSFSLLLSYSTFQYYLPASIPPFSLFLLLQSFQILLQLLPGSSSKFWSCSSVAKLCPTFCNPMDCYMPDSSVLHFSQSLLRVYVH